MSSRSMHLWAGAATMAAFVATGTWMAIGLPEDVASNDFVRTLYRTNHVYILFCGMLILTVGVLHPTRTVPRAIGWRKAATVMLLTAPIFFVAAFIMEPPRATHVRPLTAIASLLAFAAVMAHLRSSRIEKRGR